MLLDRKSRQFFGQPLSGVGGGFEKGNPMSSSTDLAVYPTAQVPVADRKKGSLRGYVDRISDGEIVGWAFDPQNIKEKAAISVFINGKLVGSAECSEYRADLAEAGLGNGCHGFVLSLGGKRFKQGRQIEVVAELKNQRVILINQNIDLPSDDLISIDTLIHLDITDLMFWAAHHPHVSGIQRVQCGYIQAILSDISLERNVRFCVQSPSRRTYRHVSTGDIRRIVEGLLGISEDGFTVTQELGRSTLHGCASIRVGFKPGDIFCIMGAPWIFPSYFKAVQALKEEYKLRYVHIFYDAIPIVLPETCDKNLLIQFARAVGGILRCADLILSISNYSGQDLKRLAKKSNVHCPPIDSVPMGFSVADSEIETDAVGLTASHRVWTNFGVRRFVLCVGTIEPRKNHIYLYHIWKKMLAEAEGTDVEIPSLVCVGRVGWHVEEFQRYLKSSNNLDNKIVLLEGLTDGQLADLYSSCLFTVFPSYYEGWGLPVSESLMHGKVCVTSNVTSMPEAGGKYALYVDPFNVQDGYRVIKRLIHQPEILSGQEAEIMRDFVPITWDVAGKIFAEKLNAFARTPVDLNPLNSSLCFNTVYSARSTEGLRGTELVSEEVNRLGFMSVLAGPDWHDIEEWGCWSSGPVARMMLNLPAVEPGKLLCYMQLALPSQLGNQTCTVMIDGIRSFSITLSGQLSLLKIPVEIEKSLEEKTKKVLVELRIQSSTNVDPSSGDQRSMGIGLHKVFVCCANDTLARLEFLEYIV